jgi:hypothetical protein
MGELCYIQFLELRSGGFTMLQIARGIQWLLIISSLAGLSFAVYARPPSDADVAKLKKNCEAAREKALAPIRAQRTQACIDQQLRKPDHCERYYKTYGNISVGPGRAPQSGYFYDLSECQEWNDARNALRVSRSRP